MSVMLCLATYSPAGAQLLSANLGLMSKRTLQRQAALGRKNTDTFFLKWDWETMMKRILEFVESIFPKSKYTGVIPISGVVDATKVPKALEINHAYGVIVGLANAVVNLTGDKEEHKKIFEELKKELLQKRLKLAGEIKCSSLTLLNAPLGTSPLHLIGALPQTKNQTNGFTLDFIKACKEATKQDPRIVFLNSAQDCVGNEKDLAVAALLNFLYQKETHLVSLDTNHVLKAQRYQQVSGLCLLYFGDGCIDVGLLYLSGIQLDAIRVKDFASDRMVLELCSPKSVNQVLAHAEKDAEDDNEPIQNVIVTALSLVFLKMQSFAVNTKENIGGNIRVILLWCSLLWLINLGHMHATPKLNLLVSVICNCFLALHNLVGNNLRLTTSEPLEHLYAILRSMKQEFTVSDSLHLYDKLFRRLSSFLKGKLRSSKDPQKGYGSTQGDFLDSIAAGSSGSKNFQNPDLSSFSNHRAFLRVFFAQIDIAIQIMIPLFELLNFDVGDALFMKRGYNFDSFMEDLLNFLPEEYRDWNGGDVPPPHDGEVDDDDSGGDDDDDDGDDDDDDDNDDKVTKLCSFMMRDILNMSEDNRQEDKENTKEESIQTGDFLNAFNNDTEEVDDKDINNTQFIALRAMADKARFELTGIFSQSNVKTLCERINRLMESMDLKKLEMGSCNSDLKNKSLLGRWYGSPKKSKKKSGYVLNRNNLLHNLPNLPPLVYRVLCIQESVGPKVYFKKEGVNPNTKKMYFVHLQAVTVDRFDPLLLSHKNFTADNLYVSLRVGTASKCVIDSLTPYHISNEMFPGKMWEQNDAED